MGQCMSRKAAGALAASAAISHKQHKIQKHQPLRSPDNDNKSRLTCIDAAHSKNRHPSTTTKGVAMSFGFKQRSALSVASSATATRGLVNCDVDVDGNGNNATESSVDTDALASNVTPTGRSTPRLAPPKKEATGAKLSRFGFRQTQTSRQNKVADLNAPAEIVSQNGNTILKRPVPIHKTVITMTGKSNQNRVVKGGAQSETGKFTLQSTQLPRPEPVRLITTKSAKTLANTNKRVLRMYQQHPQEPLFKVASNTDDSGVVGNLNEVICDNDNQKLQLESSPNFGVRRRNSQHKPRNLEVIVTNSKTFDVRDVDDSTDSCDSIAPPPLPQLPSAFNSLADNSKKQSSYQTSLIKERTLEYQRHLDRDNHGRKLSITSSNEFSDDYREEEKTRTDKLRSEKTFTKVAPRQLFLKSRTTEVKGDSSSPSSDELEWAHGGEAMAEEISCCLSSNDDIEEYVPFSTAVIGTALQSIINNSLSKTLTSAPNTDVKNVTLTIEDPKFAAVVSNTGSLLDDETLLSPPDSIGSHSEMEQVLKKNRHSSSNSKDINEKPSPPSPGTPTNISNSLSLSDGKEDFLIDDEIADQPALVFEDNIKSVDNYSFSENTIVDSTPRPLRKMAFEGSPLVVRKIGYLQSRTGSLDTLSPCESIASDDLIMDYEYSRSSGLDDCDRQRSGFTSNDTLIPNIEYSESRKSHSDRNFIFGISTSSDKPKGPVSHSKLVRSRAGTPNLVPDSPRSLDGYVTKSTTHLSATSSPARRIMVGHLSSSAYDSDDSIRLDRTSQTAMKQDIISLKTMLLKLRRVLNEAETHSPFDGQTGLCNLINGISNGSSSCCVPPECDGSLMNDNDVMARQELLELRRQVLFLQGQLEDKEKTVRNLREQMIKMAVDTDRANSAPAAILSSQMEDGQVLCNAATQTERIRPISAGPSLLNGSSVESSAGSLVSAISTSPLHLEQRNPSNVCRRMVKPSSPRRPAVASSIPRRANSNTRISASTTTT